MLLLLLSCAYEAPVVDYGDYPDTVVLSGDIVLTAGSGSIDTLDTGDVPIDRRVGHVLVYSADDPPPTGEPVAFSTVPSSAWGAASGPRLGTSAEGVVSAPWTITGLESGTYIVTALVDNDGDFNPFFPDFAFGASCGDQIGGYLLDADSQELLPIAVEAPDHLDGISLLVSDPLPVERPAFTLGATGVDSLPHIDLEDNLFGVHDHEFDLDSTAIDHPMLSLNAPDDEVCPTRFTVVAKDLDGDGLADPHPIEAAASLGAVDMWPLVVMRHVLNEDGTAPETETISQALVDFRPNSDTGTATPFQRSLEHAPEWVVPGAMVPNVPYQTSRLPLLWTGKAVPVLEDGSYGEELSGEAVPTGTWDLVVISHTGQTWVTPNSLSSEEIWGEAALPSQASVVEVLPSE